MRRLAGLAIPFTLLLAVAPLRAQVGSTTDIITGHITDSTGHALGEATISALSVETQITRTARSDAGGRYVIVFPDGGGQYQMTVRLIGMAPRVGLVTRQGDEDRLVWDVRLSGSAVELAPITVRNRRPARTGEGPTPGSTERMLTPDALARLPIDVTDLNTLATLVPGVVGIDATDTTTAAFSVAGLRPDANAITLDGLLFGSGSVPQDALRATRVVTSTYDVARGQFSGGLIASTTRSGTNEVQGTMNYTLRDRALAFGTDQSAFGQGYSQNLLSGGLGGPLVRNRLFAFGAVQGQFRTDALPSLVAAGPTDLRRLGVSPDSVARFLSLVQGYGIPTGALNPDATRETDNYSALGRMDLIASDAHTVTLRLDWRGSTQNPSRIGMLALPATGGDLHTDGGGVMGVVTSRFGLDFINEMRTYVSGSSRNAAPFTELPQGVVDVGSSLGDGAIGISPLTFGGNAGLPQDSHSFSLQTTDELSWLPGNGHRVKLGLLFDANRSRDLSASDQLGIFRFNSLGDLAAGTPASFTRTLDPTARDATGYDYAAYLGDAWRAASGLQLTYGLRLEGSTFGSPPALNPAVDSAFGRRTDHLPREWRVSPRMGFTWTSPRTGFAPSAWMIRGGVGEFRSPMPGNLAALAQASAGLGAADAQLVCVGADAPAPDWPAFAADTASVPSACASGSAGATLPAPNVVVFDPGFSAARSWRSSFGIQHSLTALFRMSADFSYTRGQAQAGLRDLNLTRSPAFGLSNEAGRPVYAPPSAIVPATGAVDFAQSRVDPAFGRVLSARSDLSSDSKQITLSVGGLLPGGTILQTSYTLSYARDQGSATGGAGIFGSATTAGDPDVIEWARSDFERRHSFLTTVTYPVTNALEVTAIGRLSSGAPFTPMVSGDINGDGLRDDRAYIYSVFTAPSPAVAGAMNRLLNTGPARVRSCLATQLNSIAARNSCIGPWTGSLDLQLNWRPAILGLNRRLMLSVTTVNLLRGVDELLHGEAGAHGWGLTVRPDPTLLVVQGFDPSTNNFVYGVNERFGATGVSTRAIRAPFQIGIQGRFTIGPDRQRAALERFRNGGRRFGEGAGGGAGGGPSAFFQRFTSLLPNPADSALALGDALELTSDQKERLKVLADSLRARQGAIAAAMEQAVEKAGANPHRARLFTALRPRLEQAQKDVQQALKDVKATLTPEQWNSLPETIRNPRTRGAGGPGRQPPP